MCVAERAGKQREEETRKRVRAQQLQDAEKQRLADEQRDRELKRIKDEQDRIRQEELKKQLASLQRIQKVTFTQLSELREEKEYLLKKEKDRADRA